MGFHRTVYDSSGLLVSFFMPIRKSSMPLAPLSIKSTSVVDMIFLK